jgi:hypothetical protein
MTLAPRNSPPTLASKATLASWAAEGETTLDDEGGSGFQKAMSLPYCGERGFVFRKATKEIFSKLDETKAKPPIFSEHESESKAETEGGQALATPPGGEPPWSTS